MKGIFSKHFYSSARKVAFVFVAAFLTFSFFACSDDDDFEDAIAWYRNDDSGIGAITLAFYDDNTFRLHQKQELTEKNSKGNKVVNDYDIATGTYTGDPTKDGEITVTYKKAADINDLGSLSNTRFLGFGEKEDVVGNEKYPLKDIDEVQEKYTISNGKITYKNLSKNGIPLTFEGESIELTRHDE
mgnify:CR=1 FL=1